MKSIFGPQAPWIREKGEQLKQIADTEADVRARERERYEAELDAEVDSQLGESCEPVDNESTTERLARLERQAREEKAIREAVSRPPVVWPVGNLIRADQVRLRRERREEQQREQREKTLGLPALQDEYDARVKTIVDARDATIRQAQATLVEQERGAREAADMELAELGPRPDLVSVEVAA